VSHQIQIQILNEIQDNLCNLLADIDTNVDENSGKEEWLQQ
jgi:hypothetical protein